MRRLALSAALLLLMTGCAKSPAPVDPTACTATGDGLQVRLTEEARWRVHPLSADELRVPSVTVVVCNAGREAVPEQYLTLIATDDHGLATPGGRHLPALGPGEATTPLLLHSDRGVPPAYTQLWQADGSTWPDWKLTVQSGGRVLAEATVRRSLDDGPEAPGGNSLTVASLNLQQMRQLALARATLNPGSGGPTEWFVYARDAVFTVTTAPSCMALEGQTNVAGRRWALWSGGEGAILSKVGDLGPYELPGGRTVAFHPLPSQQVTFLFVEQYASCANPRYAEIWAYDHAAAALFRPNMESDNGQLQPASAGQAELSDDGTLVRKFYLNTGDTGWHTYTYRWDGPARLFRLTGHSKTQ